MKENLKKLLENIEIQIEKNSEKTISKKHNIKKQDIRNVLRNSPKKYPIKKKQPAMPFGDNHNKRK